MLIIITFQLLNSLDLGKDYYYVVAIYNFDACRRDSCIVCKRDTPVSVCVLDCTVILCPYFLYGSRSSICGSHMLQHVASQFVFCSICLVDYRCLCFVLVGSSALWPMFSSIAIENFVSVSKVFCHVRESAQVFTCFVACTGLFRKNWTHSYIYNLVTKCRLNIIVHQIVVVWVWISLCTKLLSFEYHCAPNCCCLSLNIIVHQIVVWVWISLCTKL
jgi:hypothetical protein